jgi:Zn-dependent metalloprotease
MGFRAGLFSLFLILGPGLRAEDGEQARASLLARRPVLGLDAACDFRVLDIQVDPAGTRHVRLQQLYHSLRVWGGQMILHLDRRGRERPPTDALVRGIQLQPEPNLLAPEVLAIARGLDEPEALCTRAPTSELLVYPETALQPRAGARAPGNAASFRRIVSNCRLAYHVHLERRGRAGPRHDDSFIDASTGAVLKRWSSLRTAGTPATSTGHSEYNGEVRLGSQRVPCGYVLADPTRGGSSTRDLAGATDGDGRLYVSARPLWGDGQNYDAGRGSQSANGQTAAVDAHFGLMTTWDFYRNILGRNGVDGKGRAVRNRVHYDHGFDNAFWSDDCFCMTYGDGTSFRTLTCLDVVGHEISHGLCHATADLEYSGESGGLNEASSDIFGVMINFYAKGAQGKGTRIPDRQGVWTLGAELATAEAPGPIRYLDKPSRDGSSLDAWDLLLGFLDVHHSSGPMNRAFYFLSQGASSRKGADGYSEFLPEGMRGIGNDKALRIWWQTLATRLTPGSGYQEARDGAIQAARELYGGHGPEVVAVRSAFEAINVGENLGGFPPGEGE